MKLENEYVNGEINLKEYRIEDMRRYWLRVGVGLLELKEEHLLDLYELLQALIDENIEKEVVTQDG